MNKDKLIKLLKGSQEDALIALRFICNNNPIEFIASQHTREELLKFYPDINHKRPAWIYNPTSLTISPFHDSIDKLFYYIVNEQLTILYSSYGLCVCEKCYNIYLPTFQH